MAWKGVGSDSRIWLSQRTSTTDKWSAPRFAEPSSGGILTSHGPAFAITRDVAHLAWKGAGDQHIWWSDRQGSGPWTPPKVLNPGINSSASPALASHAVFLL
jgi:hypothetical protein